MSLAVVKTNVLKYEDEVVYRKRSSRIECIHEFNQETGGNACVLPILTTLTTKR